MAKDNINPNHYKFGNFETIDLIQEVVEDFGSVCQASDKRSEETNHQEDFSPFDKLHSLLNDQEKELLKDKNIKVIHINGLRMLEDFIKEKEDRRNGKHEANR